MLLEYRMRCIRTSTAFNRWWQWQQVLTNRHKVVTKLAEEWILEILVTIRFGSWYHPIQFFFPKPRRLGTHRIFVWIWNVASYFARRACVKSVWKQRTRENIRIYEQFRMLRLHNDEFHALCRLRTSTARTVNLRLALNLGIRETRKSYSVWW
jgi:hypothetical protein